MPSSKAAASEEARRYGPHFVWPFARRMDLGERISPASVSDLRKVLFNVEPLSDARPTPGERRVSARQGWAGEKSDFFSILLNRQIKNSVKSTPHPHRPALESR
jgi:hypothetical protein